jgi:DNA ligase D-like protein (predicted 3'-phosphoesterase)
MAQNTTRKPGSTGHHGKLGDYRGKRNLAASGEPAGGRRRARGRPRFVVQEHQASTLHYDFRLEAGGVLKSWAIPKGPAADPADKRLAMPTEDHPLEYEDFEGVIPEGEYGAGEVIVWDTGIYDNQSRDRDGRRLSVTEAISRGHVSVVLHGSKLTGGYSLTRMRRGGRQAWLLVKKADEFAGGDPVKTRPESVKSGKTIDQVGNE